MTIDDFLKKQDYYNKWEYVGELDGVQLYILYNSNIKNSCIGFPYFVKENKNGHFTPVTEIDEILKCNAFYNNSFPDTEEEIKNK